MTNKPARPEGYGYEYVPAMDSPKGKTEPNWRVSDPRDNRIATCYDEANCRVIVAALNGAPIVSDPVALEVIREQVKRLVDLSRRNGGPAGVELAGIAHTIAAAVDGITKADRAHEGTGGVQPTREGALEPDPYAIAGFDFADLLDWSRDELTIEDHKGTVSRRVRDRVLDDVHASHRMLDALGIAGGVLTARIGLALGWKVLERERRDDVEGHEAGELTPDNATRIFGGAVRRTHGSGEPLADADAVKIPRPDDVLADLDKLSGEEAFRLFDRLNVLPPNTHAARPWNLLESADVSSMVAECCTIAMNAGKLGELARAAREAVAGKGGT